MLDRTPTHDPSVNKNKMGSTMHKLDTSFHDASIHRQLAHNASRSAKHGILIQVDSINTDGDVAYCSVEQRGSNPFRRKRSMPELVWRAEQALAPLIGLGILPLITVRHKDLANDRTNEPFIRSFKDTFDVIVLWLGMSWLREGFTPIPVTRDPFGWRQALRSSRRK